MFKFRFMAEVPPVGRNKETLAMLLEPPVMSFAKILLRMSMPVVPVVITAQAADKRLVAAVPNRDPKRFTEF